MIRRAEAAVYPSSSLRELPESWRRRMFEADEGQYGLHPRFRENVQFVEHDIREGPPDALEPPLDVVACRYLAHTYFSKSEQRAFLERTIRHLRPGGLYIVDADEIVPSESVPLRSEEASDSLFERVAPETRFPSEP